MKIAGLLAIPLLALAADPPLISQDGVQSAFDKAISKADRIVISRVVVTPGDETKPLDVRYVSAWEITDATEISALCGYIRFRLPPPREWLEDGKLRWEGMAVGSYAPFTVTIRKEDQQLLELLVWSSCVGSHELCVYSAFRVDEPSLKPFYRRVMDRIEKIEANQAPQRNAGSRPSSGDSPASETPSSLGPRG